MAEWIFSYKDGNFTAATAPPKNRRLKIPSTVFYQLRNTRSLDPELAASRSWHQYDRVVVLFDTFEGQVRASNGSTWVCPDM